MHVLASKRKQILSSSVNKCLHREVGMQDGEGMRIPVLDASLNPNGKIVFPTCSVSFAVQPTHDTMLTAFSCRSWKQSNRAKGKEGQARGITQQHNILIHIQSSLGWFFFPGLDKMNVMSYPALRRCDWTCFSVSVSPVYDRVLCTEYIFSYLHRAFLVNEYAAKKYAYIGSACIVSSSTGGKRKKYFTTVSTPKAINI